MAVGSLEEYRLAVDQNLCVLEFNLAETDFHRYHLTGLAAVFQGCTQGVQVRCFRTPLLRVFYLQGGGYLAGAFHLGRSHGLVLCIQQFQADIAASFQIQVDGQ